MLTMQCPWMGLIYVLSNLELGDKALPENDSKIKLTVISKQEHHAIVYRDI